MTDILPLVSETGAPSFQVRTNSSGVDDDVPFDQIFYAAPWYSSPKDLGFRGLSSHLLQPIPFVPLFMLKDVLTRFRRQKYVHLHVTLLTTTQPHPLPSFFGLPDDTIIPTTILTTGLTSRSESAHPPPRFQSITWHGETFSGSGEYVVKIFSTTYVKDQILRNLIGEEPTWLLRKEWSSYPELRPISTYAPVEPVKGLQYLAALEPWVST